MNFVFTLTKPELKTMMFYYKLTHDPSLPSHTLARYKSEGITITLYHSGKVMFQGANAEEHYLQWVLKFDKEATEAVPDKEQPKVDYFKPSIGSDESGVGDYFGPLTACAAYVSKESLKFLKPLGIKDSKLISDADILRLAPKLVEKIPYSLMVLPNEKYNSLQKQGYNAHKLKAYLHAHAHKKLLAKLDNKPIIIVDQFCEQSLYMRYLKTFKDPVVPDVFITKAESIYASVAVASIIARYAYLKHMEALSVEVGEKLIKGASKAVDEQAKRLYQILGEDFLTHYTKVHFRNTERVINA